MNIHSIVKKVETKIVSYVHKEPSIRCLGIPFIPPYLLRTYIKGYNNSKNTKPENLKKVINIGGILNGGIGKTPLTAFIGRYFLLNGKKVTIITNGYNSIFESKEKIICKDKNILSNVFESGDESFMLAKKLFQDGATVIAGKDKIKCMNLAEKSGSDVIIFDDAWINTPYKPDIQIVCINGNELTEKIFPFGNKKIPLNFLESADLIVSIGNESSMHNFASKTNIPMVEFDVIINKLTNINKKKNYVPDILINKKVLLISGIAYPERFENMIKRYKIKILDKIIYPDHWNYTQEDIEQIEKKAEKMNADMILTTQKDSVKLENYSLSGSYEWLSCDIDLKLKDDLIFYYYLKKMCV